MKKIVSLMLSLVMVCSLSVSVFAAQSIKGFSDVPENHWAYAPIMEMTSEGIFAGTTAPDANGIATFSPNKTMTRAEFVTLVSRVCNLSFAEVGAKAEEMAKLTPWYHADWKRCVEHGLLGESEFGGLEGMTQPITREEMALLACRILEYRDEDIYYDMDLMEIPDWEDIDNSYTIGVLICYEKGILVGVDDAGSFNPKGVLTRAQGATVLYRVLNEDVRVVPTIPVRDIPSLNLDMSVPTEMSENCGSAEYLSLMDKDSENCTVIATPIKIYETKDFTYDGEYYSASEGKHYFIMDIELYNDNVSFVKLSDYFFKVIPNAFVTNHDTFVSYSKMSVFDKDTITKGESALGFVVFEIPSTCDFVGENSLSFHISGVDSHWTSGGAVDLFN